MTSFLERFNQAIHLFRGSKEITQQLQSSTFHSADPINKESTRPLSDRAFYEKAQLENRVFDSFPNITTTFLQYGPLTPEIQTKAYMLLEKEAVQNLGLGENHGPHGNGVLGYFNLRYNKPAYEYDADADQFKLVFPKFDENYNRPNKRKYQSFTISGERLIKDLNDQIHVVRDLHIPKFQAEPDFKHWDGMTRELTLAKYHAWTQLLDRVNMIRENAGPNHINDSNVTPLPMTSSKPGLKPI